MVSSIWADMMLDPLCKWMMEDSQLSKIVFMIFPRIKVISWNVQRAASRDFMRTLKDLIRSHGPSILILLETRISELQVDKVCTTIGFDDIVWSEVVGFRGGIWILWRKDRVQLSRIDTHARVVSIGCPMVLSAIYASPQPASRKELCERLREAKNIMDEPWLLIGDFNETMSLSERIGH
ncbi:hypothetical protein V2J09_007101 [Rumex salicifolius]